MLFYVKSIIWSRHYNQRIWFVVFDKGHHQILFSCKLGVMFLLVMVPLCRMRAVVFSRNDGIKSRYISPIASPLKHVAVNIWLEILLYGGSSIKNVFIVQIACSKINSWLKTIDLIKFHNLFQKWWLHQQVKVSRKKNLITADRKFLNFAVWW